ncbi:hypothetical protein PENTCL1PPCAC_3292, partial [Pristionchus entomophagus]
QTKTADWKRIHFSFKDGHCYDDHSTELGRIEHIRMIGLALCNASLVSLFLSVLLNGLLVFVVILRKNKVDNYRRFFYVFCLLDVVFSAAQYIFTPVR